MKMTTYLIVGGIILLALAGVDISTLCILAIIAISIVCVRNVTRNRVRKRTIKEIDSMTGEEFEHYTAKLLTRMGYKAEVTQASGDYGADVLASRFMRGRTQKYVVQCKRYQGKVGISAVQQIVGAKAYYKAEHAMVITNSYFTPAAINLAKSNKVILWDRDILQAKMQKGR